MSGLMQGFPPANEDRATLANWRTRPFNSWAFHHVREIVPSAEIAHAPEHIWHLEPGRINLDGVDLEVAMDATFSDAVAIIHDGKLVHETWRNGMNARSPHILMSVSKSMLGLVAGTLVERGEIAEDDLASKYVPELEATAWKGVTIRNLLDMRAGVKFEEDYLATSGPIIDYRYAANWNPVPEGRRPVISAPSCRSSLNPTGRMAGGFIMSPPTRICWPGFSSGRRECAMLTWSRSGSGNLLARKPPAISPWTGSAARGRLAANVSPRVISPVSA